MRDALAWYFVVQVAGLAVWPLVARALAPLEDRGWAASKVAGLLGVAWLVWFVCMLSPLPFTRTTLIVALLAIGAGAWLLELRSGGIEPVLVWLRTQRRLVLSFEAIFLGGFVLACIGKITGASPGVAYNLAAATVPALAMIGLAALAWNLARAAGASVAWSVAGSGLATLLGLFC